MGMRKFKEFVTSPAFQYIGTETSTAAVIINRVVKLTSGGGVKHTTGTSGRVVYGVAFAGATGAGKKIPVLKFGIVDIEASSRAVKKGDLLRATSGAASTGTRLGGTVRTSSNAMTTALPVRNNIVGTALTSAAAGAGKRLVSVFVNPVANNPALL